MARTRRRSGLYEEPLEKNISNRRLRGWKGVWGGGALFVSHNTNLLSRSARTLVPDGNLEIETGFHLCAATLTRRVSKIYARSFVVSGFWRNFSKRLKNREVSTRGLFVSPTRSRCCSTHGAPRCKLQFTHSHASRRFCKNDPQGQIGSKSLHRRRCSTFVTWICTRCWWGPKGVSLLSLTRIPKRMRSPTCGFKQPQQSPM